MSTHQDLSHLLPYGKTGSTTEETLKQSILFLLSRGIRNTAKQTHAPSVLENLQTERESSSTQPIYVNERQLFLTFIKILFRYLAKIKVPQVDMRAKYVVSKYIGLIDQLQQEQQKVGDNLPLWELLRSDLRHSVGEVHWFRANDYLRLLCARKNIVLIK